MKNFDFKKGVAVEDKYWHYDIKYQELKLHFLETIDEGEALLADRISILRKYVAPKTDSDASMYNSYTKVHDVTIDQKKGSLVIIHGFA
jgi:hypothetical protein